MTSIESLGTPLAFRTRVEGAAAVDETADKLWLRSEVRALEGMQKEALVSNLTTGTVWRMVSDEGPYLQGTDLAPFPLAFYTAGAVFSFMTELLRLAAALDVGIETLEVASDHYYTMQGSALRGDMIGGAMPVEMAVDVALDGPAKSSEKTRKRLLELALANSPAEAYMRDRLENTFSLVANDRRLELEDVRQSGSRVEDPLAGFDHIEPLEGEFFGDIITKLEAAEALHGVEGGVGSSLQATQKRTLHVRGEATLQSDGSKQIRVQLFQPIGSTFRFLSEEGPEGRAPAALDYLVTGVGFCFMTQLGRYAYITRSRMASYRIVQDTLFASTGSSAEPVDTHVFLDLEETDEVARRTVFMGERTCFLHAAIRGSHPTRVRLA